MKRALKEKEKSLKSTAVDGKESPDRALEKETTQSDSAKIKQRKKMKQNKLPRRNQKRIKRKDRG